MAKRNTSRQKILDAAAELARKQGPAHVSLDAVAARAGISKGGLLYNFPTKSHLLEALVQQFLEDFAAALDEKAEGDGRSLAERYLDLAAAILEQQQPPPSGLLAALAENPGLLAPVRAFNRNLLDRLKSETADDGAVLIFFLVMEGMRSLRALGIDMLTPEENAVALKRLREMAEGGTVLQR